MNEEDKERAAAEVREVIRRWLERNEACQEAADKRLPAERERQIRNIWEENRRRTPPSQPRRAVRKPAQPKQEPKMDEQPKEKNTELEKLQDEYMNYRVWAAEFMCLLTIQRDEAVEILDRVLEIKGLPPELERSLKAFKRRYPKHD